MEVPAREAAELPPGCATARAPLVAPKAAAGAKHAAIRLVPVLAIKRFTPTPVGLAL